MKGPKDQYLLHQTDEYHATQMELMAGGPLSDSFSPIVNKSKKVSPYSVLRGSKEDDLDQTLTQIKSNAER